MFWRERDGDLPCNEVEQIIHSTEDMTYSSCEAFPHSCAAVAAANLFFGVSKSHYHQSHRRSNYSHGSSRNPCNRSRL
jgi:hypothetical protein